MNNTDNYSCSRVPASCRLPFLNIALVHAGMLTALDQFMLGALLGHTMTIQDAFIAISLASLVFGLLTFALGYAGIKEGLTVTLLSRWCGFGRIGSVLVSLLMAVSLLGWFGIQNAVFARGINHALGGIPGFALSATVSGILLTTLVTFGIRALKITTSIAVPLFIMVITLISFQILSEYKEEVLLHSFPSGERLSIPDAITVIMGGCIVAALMTPDISRYARKTSHVAGMILFTIIAGEFLINGLALILARALNTADVVIIMSQTAGGIGSLAVIFSTLRVNDLNLYSSSLGIANAFAVLTGKKVSYTTLTLLIGLAGTALSVLGILERFVDFLNLLGIVFSPVSGVMVVSYFTIKRNTAKLAVLRNTGRLPDDKDTPLIGWNAIFACTVGTLIGRIDGWGVSAVNSLVVAAAVYWASEKVIYGNK